MKTLGVVGYTFEGCVYCPECVAYTDPTITGDSATDNREDKPAPFFSSDEIPGYWFCLICEYPFGDSFTCEDCASLGDWCGSDNCY